MKTLNINKMYVEYLCKLREVNIVLYGLCGIESVNTMSMKNEITEVLCGNKALFETRK